MVVPSPSPISILASSGSGYRRSPTDTGDRG